MSRVFKTSQAFLRGFLLFPALLVFIACAAVPTVTSAQTAAVSFPTVESVQPQWQPYADGIGYLHGRIANPRIEFWGLRIDLAANIRVFVSGGGTYISGAAGGGTVSTRVTSFVRDNNLLAGINTVPFDIITSREGQPIRNMGVVISNGILISPPNRHYDALVFYKTDSQNVRAAIVSQASIRSYEDIENAVGGFHQILINGEPAQRTQSNEGQRHPRSAAGVSPNGGILYLLVIDGRRAGSAGASEMETALILRALGSHNGINLDGGGSSALALRYSDGQVRTVNTPVHGGIPGQERAVAGSLGIGR